MQKCLSFKIIGGETHSQGKRHTHRKKIIEQDKKIIYSQGKKL